MSRCMFIVVIFACICSPAFAIVESLELQTTLVAEQHLSPTSACSSRAGMNVRPEQPVVTELENCGISMTVDHLLENGGDFRYTGLATSPYGRSSLLLSRRFPLPVQGLGHLFGGPGLLVTQNLLSSNGAAAGSTSFSHVERVPAPRVDFESATLALGLKGEGLEHLSVATANVFDHDTGELLLSWTGEPLELNFGEWYLQEVDFTDRVGHAIRFEFEATGRTVGTPSRITAVTMLQVPEPGAQHLVMPILLALGAFRRRRICQRRQR